MKREYIIYRTKTKFNGTGYYVKYKNYDTNVYTETFHLAKRYSSLSSLIRYALGVHNKNGHLHDYLMLIQKPSSSQIRVSKINKLLHNEIKNGLELSPTLYEDLGYRIEYVDVDENNTIVNRNILSTSELHKAVKEKYDSFRYELPKEISAPLKVTVVNLDEDDSFWN